MLRRLMFITGMAAAFLCLPFAASAQELAVEGRTPASPIAILSVPNAASAWSGFSGSLFGRALLNQWAQSRYATSPQWSSFQEQRPAIESEIGFSLNPDAFFGDVITGFDFYVVQGKERDELVLNLRFREITRPGRVLDRLRKEAFVASGVAYGQPADTIREDENSSRRVLYLPAFNLYLAADGNVLMAASSEKALESAAIDQGGSFITSSAFQRLASGIADEKHNVWLYGSPLDVAMATNAPIPAQDQVLPFADKAGTILALDLKPEHYRLIAFQPRENLTPAELRNITGAPPAGEIPALSILPMESLAAYATNHFDTELIFGLLGESLPENQKAMFEENLRNALSAAQASMSNKTNVRQDILSNLGPGLALAITEFQLPSGGMNPLPSGDFLVAVQLKQPGKYVEVFENQITRQKEAQASGQQTPDSGQVVTRTYMGEKIYSYADNQLRALGFTPSWAVTSEGWLLFTAKEQSLSAAVDRVKRGTDSFVNSRAISRSRGLLPENRNVVSALRIAPLIDLARSAAANPGAGMTSKDLRDLESVLGLIGTFESITFSSRYSENGVKRVMAFLM